MSCSIDFYRMIGCAHAQFRNSNQNKEAILRVVTLQVNCLFRRVFVKSVVKWCRIRSCNAPVEDDDALAREDYTLSHVDESSDTDTESDSEATEGGTFPWPDSVRDTEGSEGDVDEFNMLTWTQQ